MSELNVILAELRTQAAIYQQNATDTDHKIEEILRVIHPQDKMDLIRKIAKRPLQSQLGF